MVVTADPTDYQTGAALLGCNHLRCHRCGTTVRQRAGVHCPRLAHHLPELAAAADWAALTFLRPYPTGRLYACRCAGWLETSYHPCHDPDPEPDPTGGEPRLPWACAGHPIATLPLDVDGERLAADTDLDAFAGRVLAGWSPARSPAPCPWSPAAWLHRVRVRCADLPIAAALSRAVARWLGDRERRAGVLAYFCGYPRDPGFERVVEEADDPARLHARTATRVPEGPASRYAPVEALRGRLFSVRGALDDLDRAALALLQRSWLRGDPGLEREDLDAVEHVAAPWIAEAAAPIARAAPARALTLLDCLRDRGHPDLVAVAGVALAGEPAVDRGALRAWLADWSNRHAAYPPPIARALEGA